MNSAHELLGTLGWAQLRDGLVPGPRLSNFDWRGRSMGTPLFGGGGVEQWAPLHYRTEISSHEAFDDTAAAGVDRQGTGPAATRRSASAEGCRR